HRDYSEDTAVHIDAQVRRLVTTAYDKAKQVIQEQSEALVRIAEALLEREVLDGSEIKLLIEGKTLPTITGTPKEAEPAPTQKVLRPEPGKRIPGLSEGERPQPA